MPEEDHERDAHEAQTEAVLAAFAQAYVTSVTFDSDRELRGELEAEARPAVQSLLLAISMDTADDQTSLDHHEGIAMTTLLGRRAALVGASPSAATAIVPSLQAGFAKSSLELSQALGGALRVAFFEGYVMGREELVRSDLARAAAESIPTMKITERAHLLVLSGEHEADVLEGAIEEFARRLLRADALACLIDISSLRGVDRARAGVVFGAHVSARTIGVQCIFSGVDESWREAIIDAAIDAEELTLHKSFAEALAALLQVEGLAMRKTLPEAVRRLLGRS